MRISDWSSDVCSSDLASATGQQNRTRTKEESEMTKNKVCIWYDKEAEAAARFYAATFPDSRVDAVTHAPADYPSGKAGDVILVEFTVAGIPCIGDRKSTRLNSSH